MPTIYIWQCQRIHNVSVSDIDVIDVWYAVQQKRMSHTRLKVVATMLLN